MKPTPAIRSSALLSLPFASAIAMVFTVQAGHAQTIQWVNGSNATAWYTNTHWSPNTAAAAWTTANVAQFQNTGSATTAGINMGTASLSIGAIEITSARTRALTIGNSSGTSGGTLTLNGASVNSVDNVILRNASNSLLTLQNAQGSGNQTMNVVLADATDNVVLIEGSGGVTISSSISGTDRQLTRQGAGSGSLTLSGDNSFSGGLNYSGLGVLALQHGNAAGTGTITLASTQTGTAATFTLSGAINVANAIIMDAATGRNTVNSLSGSNTFSGNITINNSASNIIAFNNNAGVGTTYTIGGDTPDSTTITAATFSSQISFRAGTEGGLGVLNSRINAPDADFNGNNNGNWTINSTDNIWRVTTLTSASRFVLGATDALATGARANLNGTGFIDLNGFDQTVAGLGGSNSNGRVINNSSTADSTLTLAGLTADADFIGSIRDGATNKVSLVVNNGNAFTQTLSGNNSFTGDTTVSAGTLLVNGSLGSSAVTVDPLAVIGGTGSLGGSLSFAGNSFFEVVDLADALAVTGTVTFGSGFGIANLLGINWDDLELNTAYPILASSQDFSLAGLDNFDSANPAAVGNTGRQAYFTNGNLAVVVIPEPSAALLGGLGLLALLRRRRA